MFGSSRSSKTAKCKMQLKLVVSRIKILRNKREIQVRHLRRDVAQLLQNKQEANARTRVEHAIREQNMLAAYNIIEGYCEFLSPRIQSLSGQRECPAELKEAIASLIYAGPRCADLPELLEIRSILTAKFGKQFIATIVELRVGCGVSKRIIETLSSHPVTAEARLKFMAEAAKEHNVKWVPEDLSLSFGDVKQQQTPEATRAATAKPRPSVVTVPANLNNLKNTTEDFHSPKSPLSSVRSNGAGYDANSELDDSDEDQGKPEPPSPVPVRKPSAVPQQQQQQPQQQQPQHQQFIPFVGGPSKPPAEDPYAHYNRGIVNPYVQRPGAAKPENITTPADPYAEYQRKFMANNPSLNYADVASAAEAAAESADHAAAAARAAANLAHKQLSRESSMVDGDKVPKPVRKSSAVNLEDRVASYLKTHPDETDSSEWDSPMPKEQIHPLNPSRNLSAEQKRAERDEMTRRSTGSVTMASERVPGQNVEKRLSLGAARANQDEYNALFNREASRAKQEYYKGLFSSTVREEASPRAGKPVFDEEVFKPSANADVLAKSSGRPVYDEDYDTRPSRKWDYGNRKELHEEKLPVFDDPPTVEDTVPTTSATFGKVDSFTVHLESMDENILSKTDKLFEKEDSDASPVTTRRKSTKFGGAVMQRRMEKEESSSDEEELSLNVRKPSTSEGPPQFDVEVKLPSPRTEPAEHDNKTEDYVERTSWTGSSRPPARPPPSLMNVNTNGKPLNFQTRFHGSGVDYTETSSLKKPYRFGGASVRTKKS